MKIEARILVSACSRATGLCVGAIVRGLGVDGVVAARGCEELCTLLEEKGYSGELRYYWGECGCGFLRAEYRRQSISVYERFLEAVVRDLERLATELSGY